MSGPSLAAAARAVIDANVYMTLGTRAGDGSPWVSPVFYAASAYRDFYWISSPDATHSRNLAQRPQVSLVIFDSRQPPGSGQAVYIAATAEELTGAEVARGLTVYPGPAERGATRWRSTRSRRRRHAGSTAPQPPVTGCPARGNLASRAMPTGAPPIIGYSFRSSRDIPAGTPRGRAGLHPAAHRPDPQAHPARWDPRPSDDSSIARRSYPRGRSFQEPGAVARVVEPDRRT